MKLFFRHRLGIVSHGISIFWLVYLLGPSRFSQEILNKKSCPISQMVAPCEQTRWLNSWSYTWHHPWCVYRWHHSVLLAWQHPITVPSTRELNHQFTINWDFWTFRKSSCTPTTSAGTTLNSSINSVVLWNRRIINHRRSRDLRTLLLLDKIHLSPGRLTPGSNVFVTHFFMQDILYLQRYFNWNNLCRNTLRFFKHQTLAPSIKRLTNYCQ